MQWICFFMLATPLMAATQDSDLVDPYSMPLTPYSESLETLHFDGQLADTFQVVIDPISRSRLSTEIQSPVVKISKRLGDAFKKGDTLIELDDAVFAYNLKKNEALLEKAVVELEAQQELYDDNVASLFELKEAEANAAIARSDLSFAEKNMDATAIRAPYDGKVVKLDIEEHELPQKGQELVEVINDKVLVAKLLIPSSMINKISIGSPFKIHLPEADQTLDVTISRIGAVIDPSSSTIQIEADINNDNGNLWAGMTGSADFDTIDKTINTATDNPKSAQ